MTAKHPSTLSSAVQGYYEGLVDRLTTNLLPTLRPFFEHPTTRRVLELSSGNGTHAALYAKTWPRVLVQPTECDEWGCAHIDETVRKEGVAVGEGGKEGGGVEKAVVLDVLEEEGWEALSAQIGVANEEKSGPYDLVIGSNFLHMVSFPDGPRAIFSHLHSLVSPSAKLLIYGPFKSDEGYFSEADKAFETSIRSRPNGFYFGLRSIDALGRLAQEKGWVLEERIGMPKGNWVLVFARQQ
ncbi:hypothetical protein JCM6882_000715 [Rhodosporidiobolus microsporus]